MEVLRSTHDVDVVMLAPGPCLLVKHSTRCPISAMAMREIAALREREPDLAMYLVDVNERQDVSRYIAERLALQHDSPQAVLLLHGEAVWHAEHLAIGAREIARQLAFCSA